MRQTSRVFCVTGGGGGGGGGKGAQLILAYSWARPAILAGSKARRGMFYFFCFLTFIHSPLSPLSLTLFPRSRALWIVKWAGAHYFFLSGP